MILLAVPAMCQKRSGELEFPVLLDMSQDISKNFRDFEKDMADLEFLEDKFYPIGWSKDGKFAYFVEPADEACGCYFGTFVIQDLKTDKVLWQHRHVSDEMGSVGDERVYHPGTKGILGFKECGICKKLKAFGIEAALISAENRSAKNQR